MAQIENLPDEIIAERMVYSASQRKLPSLNGLSLLLNVVRRGVRSDICAVRCVSGMRLSTSTQ